MGGEPAPAPAVSAEARQIVVIVPWRSRFDFQARSIERDLEARGINFVRRLDAARRGRATEGEETDA